MGIVNGDRASGMLGTVEIDDQMDHVVTASHIFLRVGQFRAGEWGVYEHNLEIRLTGDTQSFDFPLPGGTADGEYVPEIVMGAKSIGSFGELKLEGKEVGTAWTKLSENAEPGSKTLVLRDAVEWQAGDEIFVTSTSFRAHESQKLVIESISADGKMINVTEPLTYRHQGQTYNESGVIFTIAAEVGLLTRNIKIIGESFEGQDEKEFGCRVLVSRYYSEEYQKIYTG